MKFSAKNDNLSQLFRIRDVMEEAGMTEGSRACADISFVETAVTASVVGTPVNEPTALFCNARLENFELTQEGNGNPLPERVTVLPFQAEKSGFGTLTSVILDATAEVILVTPNMDSHFIPEGEEVLEPVPETESVLA